MLESDYDAFYEVIAGFAELKGKELSLAAIKLYWGAMRHWDIADFRQAAEHLLRTCTFMPTPKDFENLRKAGRPTAAEAWERARRACGSAIQCGQVTHNGTCGDELIDRAVRGIGGYGVIAMTDTEKLPFLERRFAEHYDDLQDAEDTREAVPVITAPQTNRTLRGPVSARDLLPGLDKH
jgi:hypothetical protein